MGGLFRFTYAVVIGFFIPGYLLLGCFKEDNIAIGRLVIFSILIGIVASTAIFTILGYLKLFSIFEYLYLFLTGVFFVKVMRLIKLKKIRFGLPASVKISYSYVWFGLFLFLCIASFMIILWPEYRLYPEGMRVYGHNMVDVMHDIARTAEVMRSIPKHCPFIAQAIEKLHFFHYVYAAIIHKFSGADIIDIYYRFHPLLYPILLNCVLFWIGKDIFKSEAIGLLFIGCVYLSMSFTGLVNLFRIFFLGQNWRLFDMWYGPVTALSGPAHISLPISALVFFCGFYWFGKSLDKSSLKNIVLSGLFFGMLFGFRAPYSVVVFISLLGLLLLNIILKRPQTQSIFLVFLLSAIITLPISKVTVFAPSPISTIQGMETITPFFFRSITTFGGVFNIIKYLLLMYGLQLVSFAIIFYYLYNLKRTDNIRLFLAFLAISAFALHNFFWVNQGEFIYASILGFPFLTALFLYEIYKQNRVWVKVFVPGIFIIVSLPMFLHQVFVDTRVFHAGNMLYTVITNDELSADKFLREQTKFDSVILVPLKEGIPLYGEVRYRQNLEDFYKDIYYKNEKGQYFLKGSDFRVCAMSERRTVLEGGVEHASLYVTLDFAKKLRNAVERFYATTDKTEAMNLMDILKSDYVLEEKNRPINFNVENFLEPVYENDSIRLYRLVKDV